MNDQRKPPELFAERPITSDFARARGGRTGIPYAVRRLITLFIVCCVLGTGIYYALSIWNNRTPSEIPTIKSEGNYKQRPEQPGGIDIPHQDVQVYQSLDKSAPKDQVEHLLPMPETPQATKPVPMPKDKAVDAVTQTENLMSSENSTPTKVVTTVSQDKASAPIPAAAPVAAVSKDVSAVPKPREASPPIEPVTQPTKTVKTTVAPVTAAKPSAPTIEDVINDVTHPAPATSKTTTSATASSFGQSVIQLAALPDQSAANSLMQKLQAQHENVLGAAKLRLVKADLGAKGIYYRIQSQPISDSSAKNICAQLKDKKAGCILVHP